MNEFRSDLLVSCVHLSQEKPTDGSGRRSGVRTGPHSPQGKRERGAPSPSLRRLPFVPQNALSIREFRNPEVHLPFTWRDFKSAECPSRTGVWPEAGAWRGRGSCVALQSYGYAGGSRRPWKAQCPLGNWILTLTVAQFLCGPRRVTSLMASASSSVKQGVTWLNYVGNKMQPPPELGAPASVS